MNYRSTLASTLVIAACSLLAARAEAADDPGPVNLVAQADGSLRFDAPLPASTFFTLQYKDPNATTAVVRIWPFATLGRCQQSAGETPSQLVESARHGTQFHELAMQPSGTGTSTLLAAKIPPLQVDQRFCVQLDVITNLTDGTVLSNFASKVADDVVTRVTPAAAAAPPASPPAPPPPLDAAVRQAVNHWMKSTLIQESDPLAQSIGAQVALLVDTKYLLAYDADVALANARAPAPNLAANKASLTAQLVTALKESVRDKLSREVVFVGSGNVGEGATEAAANYAAVDTGVVAAFPFAYAGGDGTPWVLPYVGLNLYSVPVDRTIALDQLVGQVRQRLSLTIGRTLSSPTVTNRSVTDFGFGYPVVAVGYRVSQFVRATAGSVFFRASASNPSSAGTVFGVAPFVGLALDGDVIAIAQGKLFAPKQ